MTTPTGQMAFVEMHDARVNSVTVASLGIARLELAHVAVYHEVSKELYDIWSYRAIIQCQGISKLELTGPLNKDDRVSEGVISDEHHSPIELAELVDGIPARTLELVFGSGTRMVVHASSMRLELLEPLRRMEQWRGPLSSTLGE
jgi:hypothetical protein